MPHSSDRPRRRVLMIVENLPVPFDRRVWQEARTLRDAGYEVSVICPKGRQYTASRETVDGIAIHRHPLPEARGALGFFVEYALALVFQTLLAWRLFLTRGFDVIHAANPPDLTFLVAAPFKLFGVKYIFDHHDIMPELFEEKFKRRGFGHAAMLLTERLSMRTADAVISTNESYRQIAIERGGKDPGSVFVVRSGPDISRFKPTDPDPAIRAKATYIVGYVGIMGSQDGVDDLLRIIAHTVHDLGATDTHFLLIGDGPERPGLEAMARDLGIADHVTFTGYLRGDDLNRALSSIDLGVCPDPCNAYTTRCTMNKVMEYMAMKTPLVQFDLIDGRRSAEDAAAYAADGDLMDFARQIRALLDDPERRRAMAERGYHRITTRLQWRNEVPSLLAAYRHIGLGPAAVRAPAEAAPAAGGGKAGYATSQPGGHGE